MATSSVNVLTDSGTFTDHTMQGLTGYVLKRAYIEVSTVAQAALAELDLRTHSFTTLVMIVENPGISQSRLAELLKMERSNMVVLIDELETRQLIRRKRASGDRRRYALVASAAGKRLATRAWKAANEAELAALSALTDKEHKTLMRLLGKIAS